MDISYIIVEAFTIGDNQGYTGNPAAVCFLETDDQVPDDTKQKIANTFNLSETVFVARGWSAEDLPNASSCHQNDDDDHHQIIKRTLRWFTPTSEVPLCGHATLASARALASIMGTSLKQIQFQSKFRGILSATIQNHDTITLNFPANFTIPLNPDQHAWIPKFCKLLLGRHFSGAEDVADFAYCSREKAVVIRLKPKQDQDSEQIIKSVEPNFQEIQAAGTGVAIVDAIVTIQAAKNPPHFYSRVFSPWVGLNEDPVTGVAHTILTTYWSQILGRKIMVARQASERSGDLTCRLLTDRVELSGRANIFATGTLRI